MFRINHYYTIMLAVIGAMLLSVTSVNAAGINCTYIKGNNIEMQDYSIYSKPIKSYLTVTDDGFMRIQAKSKLYAVYYDQEFNVTKRKTIKIEPGIFGGFYEDDDSYYIVTGEDNYDEDPEAEEIRVTKYTKDWEIVGFDSLYNSNTISPFDAGSLRMCKAGKYLYIRSCHLMYNGHQANIMIVFDTNESKITYYYGGVSNISTGYVSHSFNQFILYQDGVLYGFDHGDAYPRAGVISQYVMNEPKAELPDKAYPCYVKGFPGEIGNNWTGATFGGFEVGKDHILVAGTLFSDDQSNETEEDEDYRYDVVLYSVNKEGNVARDVKVKTVYLAIGKEIKADVATPHLVKTGENEYIVLWTEYGEKENTVKYVKVNGQAELLSEVQQIKGDLSDCKPIVAGCEVIWYTWKNADERFYKINLNDIKDVKIIKKNLDHEYEIQNVSKGIADLKCKKCGETIKVLVPKSFTLKWARNDGYYNTETPKVLKTGDSLYYRILSSFADKDYDFYDDYTVETSDKDNVEVDDNMVKFEKAGTYTVTIYPVYNPGVKKKVTIKVQDDTALKATGKKVKVKYTKLKKKNQTITRAKAISLNNNFNGVKFKKKSGNKNIAVSDSGKITVKKGLKKGNYTLKVKVIDKGGPYFKNKSVIATVTLTVA